MYKEIKRQVDVINQRIKEYNSLYRTAAREAGICDGEICIWSILLSTEEYSQHDLCDLLSSPKQTVNSLISGLMKRGYVFLEHVPGTRNRKVIRLTEEVQNYGRSRVMWIFEAEQRVIEETNPEEIQVLISMLEKYIRHLKREFNRKGYRNECKNI